VEIFYSYQIYPHEHKKQTMKRAFINALIVSLLTITNSNAQFQSDWINTIVGDDVKNSYDMDIDANNNIYVTGEYKITVDFDPTGGGGILTAEGAGDIFIQKMSSSGNVLWTKTVGDSLWDRGVGIAIGPLGDVYVTGYYTGTVDFDPGSGIYNLHNPPTSGPSGSSGLFILKLDTNGNFVWAKSIQPGVGYLNVNPDITVDDSDNVYITNFFSGTVDVDPSPATHNIHNSGLFFLQLTSDGDFSWVQTKSGTNSYSTAAFAIDTNENLYVAGSSSSGFLRKYTSSGLLLWEKTINNPRGVCLDGSNNILIVGKLEGSRNFDPDGTYILTSNGQYEAYVQKLDSSGNFIWAVATQCSTWTFVSDIASDIQGNSYVTGRFYSPTDFDPSPSASHILSSPGAFLLKLDANGLFVGVNEIKKPSSVFTEHSAVCLDNSNNVYTTGIFNDTTNFGTDIDSFLMTSSGGSDVFVQKLVQKGIFGSVYQDFSQDCIKNSNEGKIPSRRLLINPGNIIVTTSSFGMWYAALPIGNYTVTVDTLGGWISTCSPTQNLIVTNPQELVSGPTFGLYPTNQCPAPDISIHAPFLRPGFSNQKVYLRAQNLNIGTGILANTYAIVELDSLLMIDWSTHPYTSLGENKYQVDLDTIYPGFWIDFGFGCTLDADAVMGQSICLKAELYPVDSCSLDNTANPFPVGTSPCLTAYDWSHLVIRSSCDNDTVHFEITNTGDGDMTCYAQVQLYIDGQFIWLDSLQLISGSSFSYYFPGDGRTWRMEVDQHPLHLGNSQPSATIELCGNDQNWTPDLFNIMSHDDLDPVVDIFCGLVTGSYDPNDKTGYPLGLGDNHDIAPNQDLEYLIRFQNTGTDTAFNIVIKDTLTTDLDIFSVQSGVASNAYDFKIYGPRVLEWTFPNIMLPDSNVNEPASHGFIKFKVRQKPNLPIGTVINNSAAIYFDFNSPIFTNTYYHTIDTPKTLTWNGLDTLTFAACDSLVVNDVIYSQTGTYWNTVHRNGVDSLYTINATIVGTRSELAAIRCDGFILNGQSYSSTGIYSQTYTNILGCDSTVTLDLTILSNDTTVNEVACLSYIAPDGQLYNSTGQYMAIIPNSNNCDSSISIDLTIGTLFNISLSRNAITILADIPDASYQWLDCNNNNVPIPNATNQRFTPNENGNYAVVITKNGCSVTSDCVEMTNIPDNELGVFAYTNPITGELTIDKGNNAAINIRVFDNLGRLIVSRPSKSAITTIDVSSFMAGVYYLHISHEGKYSTHKFVKD